MAIKAKRRVNQPVAKSDGNSLTLANGAVRIERSGPIVKIIAGGGTVCMNRDNFTQVARWHLDAEANGN